MPVVTRWYSLYNSLTDLQASKYCLIQLIDEEEENLFQVSPKPTSLDVVNPVKSTAFWTQLAELVSLIAYPANIIGKMLLFILIQYLNHKFSGKFESDEAQLAQVYHYYGELYKNYEDENIKNKIKKKD
jgi:hypothetical protein